MLDSDFVKELRLFAETASVDIEKVEALLQLRIVSSFAQIEKSVVYNEIVHEFGGGEVGEGVGAGGGIDWKTIDVFLTNDKYANCYTMMMFWLKLLMFVEFVDEPAAAIEIDQYLQKLRLGISVSAPSNFTVVDAVRIAVFKVCGDVAKWDDICKTYILVNVVRDDPAAAVSAYFHARKLVPDDGTGRVGGEIARHLMGLRSPVGENQETLITLLGTYMRVHCDEVSQLLRKEDEGVQAVVDGVKGVFLARLRPSLTDLASRQNGMMMLHGSGFQEQENFQSFCRGCRFPLHMSSMMQRYIYLLKCMSDSSRGIDTDAYIVSCVNCPVLLANIRRMNVVCVEVGVLMMVIGCVRNVGEASVTMKRFRHQCMEPFFSKRVIQQSLNWTIVLKFYLAASQRENIRRECWSFIVQRQAHLGWDEGYSAETFQAVNDFAQQVPFDTEHCLRMVDQSVRALEQR